MILNRSFKNNVRISWDRLIKKFYVTVEREYRVRWNNGLCELYNNTEIVSCFDGRLQSLYEEKDPEKLVDIYFRRTHQKKKNAKYQGMT